MFTKIEDYILKNREDRRSHLKLDEDCIEIGGYDSREYRGLLAHFLKTTIPTNRKIILCHACNNHKCSNPNHLYWGTYQDNHIDAVESGSYKTIYEKSIDKYGRSEFNKMLKEAGSLGGKKGGGHNKLTEEDLDRYRKVFESIDTTKIGWVGKSAKLLGVSHSNIKRIVDKYFSEIEFYRRK